MKFIAALLKIILWPFKILLKLIFKFVKWVALAPFRWILSLVLLIGIGILILIIVL